MIKVGLTGGIGSGKSTVAKILIAEGVPVYIADEKSKYLLDNDTNVISAVSQEFGKEIYISGIADRKLLASIVFDNPERLAKLNSILHPAVERDFEQWAQQHCDCPYVVEESAILLESNAHRNMDFIVTVSAPEEVRIERATRRDNCSREAVAARIKNQMSDQQREQCADFVIVADNQKLLIPQVLELHNKLINKRL
jgi:dephospho-CoA kinase